MPMEFVTKKVFHLTIFSLGWPKDKCGCNQNYYEPFCNVTTCFGIFSNETFSVCSGHGDCIFHDVCSCNIGWDEFKP